MGPLVSSCMPHRPPFSHKLLPTTFTQSTCITFPAEAPNSTQRSGSSKSEMSIVTDTKEEHSSKKGEGHVSMMHSFGSSDYTDPGFIDQDELILQLEEEYNDTNEGVVIVPYDHFRNSDQLEKL